MLTLELECFHFHLCLVFTEQIKAFYCLWLLSLSVRGLFVGVCVCVCVGCVCVCVFLGCVCVCVCWFFTFPCLCAVFVLTLGVTSRDLRGMFALPKSSLVVSEKVESRITA